MAILPGFDIDRSGPVQQSFTERLKTDAPASLVVFLVAVPLCLGIALASGAPLAAGIIAGIVGGIVVGAASGSALGVSGPAAGLAVIVLTAIQTLGSWEAFLLAVVLAGVIQVALGFLRAGVIGYYFPSSVKGMLAGISAIIPTVAARGGHDATRRPRSDCRGRARSRQSPYFPENRARRSVTLLSLPCWLPGSGPSSSASRPRCGFRARWWRWRSASS
jgi:hypothetical protein